MRKCAKGHEFGSIGYLTPYDKLLGREQAILAERDYKLVEARAWRIQEGREQREKVNAA
ncbi:MAG: hypothetical protein KDA57_19400 [Planctomycetales bacterium]|nr:hypothetical protein [Planctomycetales bacterium]